MKIPRKAERILMGIVFAFIPGLCAGLLCLPFMDETLAMIIGGGVFFFGLDIAFGKGCR